MSDSLAIGLILGVLVGVLLCHYGPL